MESRNSEKSKSMGEPVAEVFSFGKPKGRNSNRPDSETRLLGHRCGLESSSSVSSCSSNSSFNGFFKAKHQSQHNHNEGAEQSYKNGNKMDVSSESWPRFGETGKPKLTSQFSDVTIKSFVPDVSPTRSPPGQVMERSGTFDPNRIPASIFSSRHSTSLGWSAASNDSLFSIHIGNESLSRDHALRISGDLCQTGEIPSQELQRTGELYQCDDQPDKPTDLKRPDEIIRSGVKSLADNKGVESSQYVDMCKNNIREDMKPGAKEVIQEPNRHVSEARINVKSGTNLGDFSRPPTGNCYSDGSEMSNQPLAFSKNKKSALRWCNCLSCCCKWPSCCSCKCFQWLTSRNCLSGLCCCKWCNCC